MGDHGFRGIPFNFGLLALVFVISPTPCLCQIATSNLKCPVLGTPTKPSAPSHIEFSAFSMNDVGRTMDDVDGSAHSRTAQQNHEHGLIGRSVRRGLQDQKQLYSAPFRVSNLKWDGLVLVTTGALIATDKHIEKNLPTVHYNSYNLMSNATLGTLSGGLVALWAYGIKTDNPHARETGQLELETLANTFLLYTPMQLIGARERPGEGTNNGRFGRHHSFNTSFPAGHSMFTTAMATVLAHEYPKPWVQVVAYGAAATVTAGRFIGRDHWASDIFVGNVLGYLIARKIFHAHCDPDLNEACH